MYVVAGICVLSLRERESGMHRLFKMMGSQGCNKIERKSSIESEPRTLMLHQLEDAREAALYVLSTQSLEEALRIFTEGLEPALGVGNKNKIHEDVPNLDGLSMGPMSLPILNKMKDIVSAPF